MRTRFKIVFMTILAVLLMSGFAQAADYPKSAISLIVPAAPGGGTDLNARLLAKYAKDFLGQSLVVVNVTGAGGFNGSKRVHDAAPDGYTVLFYFNNGMILNKISGIAPYSIDGFEIGPRIVSDVGTGIFVNTSSPWKNMQDFINAAKAKPGTISVATEIGTHSHYLLLSLQEKLGVQLKLVDAGSNTEKTTTLLGGHIDSMVNSYSTNQSYVKSGDFLCLGFVNKTRHPAFPDVPTIMEQGLDYSYPGYEIGLYFPKNTPKEIIATFNEVVKKVTELPAYQADLSKLGYVINYLPDDANYKDFLEMEALYKSLAASVKK